MDGLADELHGTRAEEPEDLEGDSAEGSFGAMAAVVFPALAAWMHVKDS
jgi:hypothetical protein